MGSKSRYSKYLKELGKGLIESTTVTDTSLASLLQAESEKVQELIKRNASIDVLVNSGKIFSDMMFNIALVQLIPLLKMKPVNNIESLEDQNSDVDLNNNEATDETETKDNIKNKEDKTETKDNIENKEENNKIQKIDDENNEDEDD